MSLRFGSLLWPRAPQMHHFGTCDLCELSSLLSDMLTFPKITENWFSASNSLCSDMLTFTKTSSSLSSDSSIWLLEFLGFPKGSLWEHFSDIWVSIEGPVEPFGYPWGVYWIPLGTLWIPLGTLWTPLGTLLDHFGITLVVLGPPWASFWWLLHHFSTFWLQKGPKKWWREVLGCCFCEFFDILC